MASVLHDPSLYFLQPFCLHPERHGTVFMVFHACYSSVIRKIEFPYPPALIFINPDNYIMGFSFFIFIYAERCGPEFFRYEIFFYFKGFSCLFMFMDSSGGKINNLISVVAVCGEIPFTLIIFLKVRIYVPSFLFLEMV
jgi:hypothetical protein